MVSKATDYEYVVGTVLDELGSPTKMCALSDFTPRMKFDGNILPKRSSNVVRGEDIAFLMEFAIQRYAAIESVSYLGDDGYADKTIIDKTKERYKGTLSEHTWLKNLDNSSSYSSSSIWHRGLTSCFNAIIQGNTTTSTTCIFFDSIPTSYSKSSSSSVTTQFPDAVRSIPASFYKSDTIDGRHPKLSYYRIKSYFDFCKTIDHGVCFTSSERAQTIGLTSCLTIQTDGEPAPSGYKIDRVGYSKDKETTGSGDEKKTYNWETWGLLEPDQKLYEAYAPHAKEMYALCTFTCRNFYIQTIYVFEFIKMDSDNKGTFTLLSTPFSSKDFITRLISESGLDISAGSTHQEWFSVPSLNIKPVISKFDDHTDFLSEESQS